MLRDSQGIHDWQLRFRVGQVYRFDDLNQGWSTPANTAHPLELSDALRPLIDSSPLATLQERPANDAERHAHIAMQWMERSRLEGEPLVALLYLFTALEALLGSRNEKKKAAILAFRAAILSHLVDGRFTHPAETLKMYDEIRSAAIHGEAIRRPVTSDLVSSYGLTVRWALRQYVSMIREKGLTKKSALIRILDAPENQKELAAWIRQAAPDAAWDELLSEIEEDSIP
jgi:hypothetical protein